jgi:hypothetical protein
MRSRHALELSGLDLECRILDAAQFIYLLQLGMISRYASSIVGTGSGMQNIIWCFDHMHAEARDGTSPNPGMLWHGGHISGMQNVTFDNLTFNRYSVHHLKG